MCARDIDAQLAAKRGVARRNIISTRPRRLVHQRKGARRQPTLLAVGRHNPRSERCRRRRRCVAAAALHASSGGIRCSTTGHRVVGEIPYRQPQRHFRRTPPYRTADPAQVVNQLAANVRRAHRFELWNFDRGRFYRYCPHGRPVYAAAATSGLLNDAGRWRLRFAGAAMLRSSERVASSPSPSARRFCPAALAPGPTVVGSSFTSTSAGCDHSS